MSTWVGEHLKLSVFGESHGEGIGCVLDGLPAGLPVDEEKLHLFLSRRAPNSTAFSTQRKEADIPHIVSGIYQGKTCGAPLCTWIANTDAKSGDYAAFAVKPRPGHADYSAYIRYGGFADMRGGGHFSGRLTAVLCIAGGICLQALEMRGITVGAHILSVGEIYDRSFDSCKPEKQLEILSEGKFPVFDETAGAVMQDAILAAKNDGDSLGGMIECAAIGVPAGLGDPMFDGMENRFSRLLFAIPALRGVSFGGRDESTVSAAFPFSVLTGYENNDAWVYGDNGTVRAKTNHSGGILGGITTGMPIVFTCGIKPTPSIGKEQDTVDLSRRTNCKITVGGRHDPCILPRAVPCVEAVTALVLFDALISAGEERIWNCQN